MNNELTVQHLLPAISNREIVEDKLRGSTFIGIDFGTSTTVVSIAVFDSETGKIETKPIWLNQKLSDGTKMSSEKIPTAIAWHNQQLLVGTGASDLKHQLKKGVNVWYSFKMELGEDLGTKYYNSELGKNSDFPIQNPRDAAKIFFRYLKAQIDRYIRINSLPSDIQYAVSIPASFEANQRKELIYALEQNGISMNKQSLIDEPNAAFLSYIQFSAQENEFLIIPDGDNPKVLVFDFGAGTCDISILELGKNQKGIYTKNLSISKFEKLGGDNIDQLIAADYLFPQLLIESKRNEEDFRAPEKKRIINRLLKTAEQLKIMICENIALQMSDRILPVKTTSKDYVSVGYSIEIDSRRGKLSLTEPKLFYRDFDDIMEIFLSLNTLISYKSKNTEDGFVTIFSPIQTALEKASLTPNEIDYILFIGGSSKNPYVQASLKNYFKESELLIPRDLQTHVSIGTAIHSLVYNGFGRNIIQPITSEPFLVITKDETPKIILRAGTYIPCDLIVIDDLVSSKDGQQAIELPICIGNINKLLYNIKITSSNKQGFMRNTPVRLELEITTDKLLLARATADGQTVFTEPINPFANKELTTEQLIVLKAERQVNIEAEKNGGKHTKQGLESLYKAHERVGNTLSAAETLELLNELYPNVSYYSQIGVLYSSAGYRDKALEYYQKGYESNKNEVTAFNYAYGLKSKDREKAKKVLKESLDINPNYPHSLFELGRLLKNENDSNGKELILKAFKTWKQEFESNQISKNNYSWLAAAADELSMKDFAQRVRESIPQFRENKFYDIENLTTTNGEREMIKTIEK
ncbi:Hsp70 family protein [Bacteroides sp. OttesenSCG-928-J23]|nr:Hsp70 family protein [Bacteroides sp. OttesenSCG-928-J23]MDL2303918.1 Hsp70 family protein [Bacteroides sp. OttesenSCG-928-D19]